MSDQPILVIGGGIGGLSAALALAEIGRPTRILEKTKEFSEVGAGIQLGPNAVRLLRQWGVADALAGKISRPASLKIRDALNGRLLAELPLGDLAESRYGAPYWTLHRADLQAGLLSAVRDRKGQIETVMGFALDRFEMGDGGVTAIPEAGATQTGQGLIGADGVWSRVRSLLHPDRDVAYAGKSAYRAIVPVEDVPDWVREPHVGLWMGPRCHLVHYPVKGDTAINVVAVVDALTGQRGWNALADPEELMSHYADWQAEPKAFLAGITQWRKWSLFSLPPLAEWGKGPVTLLGDAAHPPVPFLAQGGVMAMEDAQVLSREVATWQDSLADAFRRYERQRAARAGAVIEASARMGKIYHMTGPQRLARNLVLSWKARNPERLLGRFDWLYDTRV